jgi:hypothetical protein
VSINQDSFMPNAKSLRSFMFIAALVLIYGLGSYAALKSGVTWDTEREQSTLRINFNAVNGLVHGDLTAYRGLMDYQDKYYGIGFHAPAYPVQMMLYKPVAAFLDVDGATAFLRVKQWLAFNLFFASGILMLLISGRLVPDESFSRLVSLSYLLWPYLLGQALLNVKDVPFMFGWLLCSYLSMLMMDKYYRGRPIGRFFVLALAIATGWLISIRISGILIFIQYFLLFLGARRLAVSRGFGEANSVKAYLLIFIVGIALFVYLSYPAFWLNPLQVFMSILYMSHHPMGILGHCTLTLGECMPAVSLPMSYIPVWLSVKLPVVIMLGYLLLPLTLRNIAKDAPGRCFFRSCLYSSIMIPALLAIIPNLTLYNELRQVLFLMPLFYLVGAMSIYAFSRKVAIAALLAMIVLFSIDNLMAYPYQYVWFNEIARQFRVENYFETDYWGSSGRGLSRQLLAFTKEKPLDCVYADPDLTFRNYLRKNEFQCLKYADDASSASPRPFLVARYSNQGSKIYPENCAEVGREKLRLFMGAGDIVLSRLVVCN